MSAGPHVAAEVRASHVGEAVPAAFGGEVAGVFDRAIVVRLGSRGAGEAAGRAQLPPPWPGVVTLLLDGTAMVPGGIDVCGLESFEGCGALGGDFALRRGDEVEVRGPRGERRLRVRLDRAAVFDGRLPAHVRVRAADQAVRDAVRGIERVAGSWAAPACAGRAWPGHPRAGAPRLDEHARDSALRRLGALEWAASCGEARAAAAAARSLVGLGAGLTPSGDDALTGFLLAAWACGTRGVAQALAGVAADAWGRTSDVAASQLALAASRRFGETGLDIARALAAGDRPAAEAAAAHQLAVGATSGADGLAGLLAGLRACREIALRQAEAAGGRATLASAV